MICDIDVIVLRRMFDYIGHLMRIVTDKPRHLTGQIIKYKCCGFTQALTDVVGHQGRVGRHTPWSWKRQYHKYFHDQGLDWKIITRQKDEWNKHRKEWIKYMLKSRSVAANFGRL